MSRKKIVSVQETRFVPLEWDGRFVPSDTMQGGIVPRSYAMGTDLARCEGICEKLNKQFRGEITNI